MVFYFHDENISVKETNNPSTIHHLDVNLHHSFANQVLKLSGSSKCGDAKHSVDKSES